MLTFTEFIEEREAIRLKKEAGEPRPWTTDPVLHATRFTNINRNNDRGTVELFRKVKGLNKAAMINITVLFRTCYSSLLLLDKLTGDDLALLNSLRGQRLTKRMPYNVWLYDGITMIDYLIVTAMPVAEYIIDHIDGWSNRSILNVGNEIGEVYGRTSPRRMFFIGTEIAKDLSVLTPQHVDPLSKCRLNCGAIKGLKLVDRSIDQLLKTTGLSYSVLEHALCEYGKYVERSKASRLCTQWIYAPSRI